MIELEQNQLVFSFKNVHPDARMALSFQRTLRIPDDEQSYPLPPGLGRFPLRHVDDFARRVPSPWLRRGGVALPMYQSEALWLNFTPHFSHDRRAAYPFALKVATGKVNAVTGDAWSEDLKQDPQDYLVIPTQPWLDGYCVEKGLVRQFVAMPLGAGYSAEEQITGDAEHGGLQIIAYPMKRKVFEQRFPVPEPPGEHVLHSMMVDDHALMAMPTMDMGLAPGGQMRQEIYDDPFDPDDWDTEHASRCFVHIANSLVWRAITGEEAPTTPPTAEEYTRAGLPWFEYYDDAATALEGAETLSGLKSVKEMGEEKGDVPLPENEPVTPEKVVELRRALAPGQVREWGA
jgi:hypothetical protein